jgi:hypothetical protein
MEFPYAKLRKVELFTDGIRFHASNRQTAPLFKVESRARRGRDRDAAVQALDL